MERKLAVFPRQIVNALKLHAKHTKDRKKATRPFHVHRRNYSCLLCVVHDTRPSFTACSLRRPFLTLAHAPSFFFLYIYIRSLKTCRMRTTFSTRGVTVTRPMRDSYHGSLSIRFLFFKSFYKQQHRISFALNNFCDDYKSLRVKG